MTKLKETLKDSKNKMWFMLLIVSSIGIIMMLTTTYIYGSSSRQYWKEMIILYLYFTFMSNMFAVVTSAIVIVNKVNINSKHLQRTKVMMAVNLTITSIIFWAVLSGKLGDYEWPSVMSTVMVHAVTPVLALFVFFYEGKKYDMPKKYQTNPTRTTYLNIIFPFIWLLMGIGVYYALGADEDSAIYGFLDFKKDFAYSMIIIAAIAVMYPVMTFSYTYIYNK